MPPIVLTPNGEADSAKKLGFQVVTKWAEVPKRAVVIRWGHSGGPQFRFELNPQPAIKLNVDKYESKKKIASVVRAPKLYHEGEKVTQHKCIVRPAHHAAGEGFSIKAPPFTVAAGHYASEALTPSKEYRVWFDSDGYSLVGRRDPMTPEQHKDALNDFPCRSLWGYVWIDQPSEKLVQYTHAAAKALGLDFGAADFLLHDGKWYCLELNTAPSLDHKRVIHFFGRFFQDL